MDEQLPFDVIPPDDDLYLDLKAIINAYGYFAVVEALRRLVPTETHGSAPARPSDPDTSHMAAKTETDVGRFTVASRKAKLLYVYSTGDFTQQQAAVRIVGANATISLIEGTRRRVGELFAVNFIYDTGKRAKNPGSDDVSIVFGLSEAGREALIRLDDTGWSR